MKKTIIFLVAFVVAFGAATEAEARNFLELRGLSVASRNGIHTESSLRVRTTGDNISLRGSIITTAMNHEGTLVSTLEIEEEVVGPLDAGGDVFSSKQTGQPPVITGSSYGGVEWSGSYDPNPSATVQESPTVPLSGATPQQKSYVPLRGAWNW